MKLYGTKMAAARRQMVVREDSKNNGTVFVVDLEVQRTEDELADMIGAKYAKAAFAGCFDEVIPSPKGDATETVWHFVPAPKFDFEVHVVEIDVHSIEAQPKLLPFRISKGEKSLWCGIRIEVTSKPLARFFVDNRRCVVTCAPKQTDVEEKRDLPGNAVDPQLHLNETPDAPMPVEAEPAGGPDPDDIFPKFDPTDAFLSPGN